MEKDNKSTDDRGGSREGTGRKRAHENDVKDTSLYPRLASFFGFTNKPTKPAVISTALSSKGPRLDGSKDLQQTPTASKSSSPAHVVYAPHTTPSGSKVFPCGSASVFLYAYVLLLLSVVDLRVSFVMTS